MSLHENDFLTSTATPDRVAYATGTLLDAGDFRAEQTYHRGRLARALKYLHGSGTVAGLRVTVEPPQEGNEERLRVGAGLAIDRLGRLVEAPGDACLRLNRWYGAQPADDLSQAFHTFSAPQPGQPANGVVADVFIRFTACERGKTPAFATGPFDALDAVAPSRLRDAYHLSMVLRPESALGTRLPQSPWPDLEAIADIASRRETLENALLDSWNAGTEQDDLGGLVPLPEHAVDQDTTSIFLARLTIPATAGSPPARSEGETVFVDNHSRAFVYPPSTLSRWLGVQL